MATIAPFLAALLTLAAPAAASQEVEAPAHAAGTHTHAPEAPRTEPYEAAAVEAMRKLPIQERGRVKPFMTQAQYLLLRLKEVRRLRLPDEERFGALAGAKLSPTEWALDVMLHPLQAADYPVIRVTDSEVLDWVGLSHEGKKKRDSYSWNELSPAYERVWQFHGEYSHIEPKLRSRLQNQVINLAQDLGEFNGLAHSMDALRGHFPADGAEALRELFGGKEFVRFSEVVANADRLLLRYRELAQKGAELSEEERADLQAFGTVLEGAFQMASRSNFVVWLPPVDLEREEWLPLGEVLLESEAWNPAQRAAIVEQLAHGEAVVDAAADPEALTTAVAAWVDGVSILAAGRGEAEKIPLEVSYLRRDYPGMALYGFVLSFVLAALLWLWPRSKWLAIATWACVTASTLILVWGIGVRCILRGRPPVTTLYETILFITACATIVTLIAEWMNRRRVAISVGAALGVIGMFLAYRFELNDGQDTMPQLVAVLDTNFWLATHVTTVTIGYSAGLLAGFVGTVYLLGKLFGLRRRDATFYTGLGRMVYGVLCFGLFFSTVGTILGGIWANDSWGRFWGWDPKENGALLIVLWELLILHGRLGGYWRDWGTAILAVLGNIVVAFSWWGVNLMGVGLHSYGFTAGLKQAVTIFYVTQLVVVGLGLLALLLERTRKQAAAEAATAGERLSSAPASEPA